MKFRTTFFLVLITLLTQFAFARDAQLGVLVFGDFGTGREPQFKVAAAMKKFCQRERCDFVASVGDNFYPVGVKSVDDPQWASKWRDAYAPLGLQFRATLGNHDYAGNIRAQIEYSAKDPLWHMPDRYYKFTEGNVEFFAIDNERFDPAQKAWLTESLDKSTATWKVVYGHEPIYSYGQHGHSKAMIAELLPILRGRAQFYFCGHDHDRQVLEVAGDPLFVISGAAAQARPVKKGSKTIFASDALGFAHLQFEATVARVRFLGASGDLDFEKTVKLPTK